MLDSVHTYIGSVVVHFEAEEAVLKVHLGQSKTVTHLTQQQQHQSRLAGRPAGVPYVPCISTLPLPCYLARRGQSIANSAV